MMSALTEALDKKLWNYSAGGLNLFVCVKQTWQSGSETERCDDSDCW